MKNADADEPSDPTIQIREKCALLASVLGIVRFMEGLQESLEAMRLLGENSRSIPTFAQRFLGGLDKRINEADTVKLRGYLSSLERLVKQDLTRTLKLAGADRRSAGRPGDPAPDEPPLKETALVDDFRRRTLTVVCLRILLRQRGESIGALALPIPQQLLNETLAKLDQQRCEHTERALGETLMLMKDVEVQLQSQKLSESNREWLVNMLEGLQKNADHLKAGKPLSEMPVPMELSEAEDVAWAGPQTQSVDEPEVEEPEVEEPEAEEPAVEKEETIKQLTQELVAEAKENAQKERNSDAPKRGFASRVWRYVTTGPKVGWKDTGDA